MTTRKFLWGSASASYQCEGAWNEDDKVESMWDKYLHENNLQNGDIASDHYHRYEEDIEMMAKGNQNAYRFSISWPRIIKNLNGDINEKGIQHYKDVIACCKKHGIEPYVTCYHWDLPQYYEDLGGWLNVETAYGFERYCEVLFKHFNGLVHFWSTFNEPKWFIFSGYMSGNYPPNHVNCVQEVIRCGYNVMLANALAIRKFKEMKTQGEIGIVCSYQTIYSRLDTPEAKQAIRNAENYCNNWHIETACTGKFPADMVEKLKSEGYDFSFVKKEELDIIQNNTAEFLGFNYYSPQYVLPYEGGETVVKVNNLGSNYKGNLHTIVKNWFEIDDEMMQKLPHNPWGMVVEPRGLYDAIKRNSIYGLPMYNTENGMGCYEDVTTDEIHDEGRIDYIKEHIRYLLKAKKDGYDINGYFVWSPFDLYSWKNGCEKRYGLVAIDFDHGCVRKPKDSYYWYAKEIESDWQDIRD